MPASIQREEPGLENMETIRGGLNVIGKKDESNRNVNDVKDPSQLGGSRYTQHKLKSETADNIKEGDEVALKESDDYFIIKKK